MAFVDEITVYMKAGHGGNGTVRWRHEKGKNLAGASGGNGGKGGDVYAIGSRDLSILARYRNLKEFTAKSGGNGMKDSMHGENGDNLYIEVPIGSIVTNKESGHSVEVTEVGEKKLLLNGGRGGLGNEHFKHSRNTTPKEHTDGDMGEEADFHIELQLIADFGLVGLPNAGKSSLLNALTKAKAKVAAYAFTTLEPNLGVLYGYILADIPGLIEGASEGKGLGHKFLRHIRRTSFLLHCISLENEDLSATYKTVMAELSAYSPELKNKPQAIVLTKTDLLTGKVLKEKIREAKKLQKLVYTISILDDVSIKEFSETITQLISKKV